MSPHWLKFLEKFGKPLSSTPDILENVDLSGENLHPNLFRKYDVLFRLFGPLDDSLWEPYHCPTLFASIDRLSIQPKEVELSPGYHREHPPGSWQWLDSNTMVLLDLPGPGTIEVGVTLMKHGAQLVSTFDHWAASTQRRQAVAAINSTKLIDTMFTLAPEALEFRRQLTEDAPPVWLCDNRRLGSSGLDPMPGTFDNRYYIDDSILPGIHTLREGDIQKIVYISLEPQKKPLPDLTPFLAEAFDAGIKLHRVVLKDEASWVNPQPMDRPFKTKIPLRGFRRTDMGGFGKMVPEPSEGGYGSGGGGG